MTPVWGNTAAETRQIPTWCQIIRSLIFVLFLQRRKHSCSFSKRYFVIVQSQVLKQVPSSSSHKAISLYLIFLNLQFTILKNEKYDVSNSNLSGGMFVTKRTGQTLGYLHMFIILTIRPLRLRWERGWGLFGHTNQSRNMLCLHGCVYTSSVKPHEL